MIDKILTIRQKLRYIYADYDVYIAPLLKALIMFTALTVLARTVGYSEILSRWNIKLLISLIAALLPWSGMSFIAGIALLWHMLSLSYISAGLTAVALLLPALLYYLFLPGQSVIILLLPLAWYFRIPYVIPLIAGITGGAFVFIPVGIGVFIYFFISTMSMNAELFTVEASGAAALFEKMGNIFASFSADPYMVLCVIALCLSALTVHFISRLSFKYSSYVSIASGTAVSIISFFIGVLVFDIDVPFGQMILWSLVSMVIAFIANLWIIAVDYSRTEYLRYEDEDYLYYVKAVPKIRMQVRERASRTSEAGPQAAEDYHEDYDLKEAMKMLEEFENEESSQGEMNGHTK